MSNQFLYDVFLSHNSFDKPRVRLLAVRLKEAGMRVWFDEWTIKHGDIIALKVDDGLEQSRVLLLCISPNALASGWVALERSTAVHRDPANASRRFVPLLLDDCKMPDTLRRYKYVDYRDETQAAFARVLAACRPEMEAAQPTASEEEVRPAASEGDLTLLPYTCDRNKQKFWLQNNFGKNGQRGRVWFTMMHGQEKQAVSKFVECIQTDHIGKTFFLGANPLVFYDERPWPVAMSSELFKQYLSNDLITLTCANSSSSLSQVAGALVSKYQAVSLSYRFPARNWCPEHFDLIKVFVDFWLSFPLPASSAPLLIMLYIEYEPPPGTLLGRMFNRGDSKFRQNLAVFRAWLNEHKGCDFTPELFDVPFEEAMAWAKQKETLSKCKSFNPEDIVKQVYGNLHAMPMKNFATLFKSILSSTNRNQSSL